MAAPCLVPNGFGENCASRPPGGNAQRIYIIDASYVTAVTFDVDGLVTDITLSSGGAFLPVDARRYTVNAQQAHVGANGSLSQTVTMALSLLSDNVDQDIAAAEAMAFFDSIRNATNGLLAIVEQASGVRYLYGYTRATQVSAGLRVSEANTDTGTALEDASGMNLTLTHGALRTAPVLNTSYVVQTTPTP